MAYRKDLLIPYIEEVKFDHLNNLHTKKFSQKLKSELFAFVNFSNTPFTSEEQHSYESLELYWLVFRTDPEPALPCAEFTEDSLRRLKDLENLGAEQDYEDPIFSIDVDFNRGEIYEVASLLDMSHLAKRHLVIQVEEYIEAINQWSFEKRRFTFTLETIQAAFSKGGEEPYEPSRELLKIVATQMVSRGYLMLAKEFWLFPKKVVANRQAMRQKIASVGCL